MRRTVLTLSTLFGMAMGNALLSLLSLLGSLDDPASLVLPVRAAGMLWLTLSLVVVRLLWDERRGELKVSLLWGVLLPCLMAITFFAIKGITLVIGVFIIRPDILMTSCFFSLSDLGTYLLVFLGGMVVLTANQWVKILKAQNGRPHI